MFRENKNKAGEKEFHLASELFDEDKFAEAELLFRQAVQLQESKLGLDHENTLYSKFWLGMTLCRQQKYTEAELLLRQVVQLQESILGLDHEDTLNSKYWLGMTLYEQQKYTEAELIFRQVVQLWESILGLDHENTPDSKYWLGMTLYEQQKYTEAELIFRQVVQLWESILGLDHKNTPDKKYWLGITLYKQQKYTEAELLLRQVVQLWESKLGLDHENTLNSKHWLGLTLYEQQKYSEAESLLQKLIQEEESKLGPHHEVTIVSKELLQKVLLARGPAATSSLPPDAILSRLRGFFGEGTERQTPYNDSEIQQISVLLNQLNPPWSKIPRTYIILRIIGCLEFLDAFIDLGFSDHWFPVTERGLPHSLHPSRRVQFVAAQSLVMTKSLDLEKGDKGQHCHFRLDESLPFKEKGILGTGGFGQVDRILSLVSFREYARKRVPRTTVFGGRRIEDVKRFIAEIEVLKRLKHRHVAEFVGSYTDPKYIALIMSPVADMDLSAYLARANTDTHTELRTFFGCLARSLEFLHSENIRHKDIKPSNVLVHRGNVLFTDFGLALDFTDAEGSTTGSMVNGMSPKYCAPEVANFEPRNTSSDIWSLGVVFLEMTVVLKSKAIGFIDKFLSEHGSRQAFVRTNPDGLREMLAALRGVSSSADNIMLTWIQDMLMIQQNLRPTAAALIASITTAGERGHRGFCGLCCVSPDDDPLDELY